MIKIKTLRCTTILAEKPTQMNRKHNEAKEFVDNQRLVSEFEIQDLLPIGMTIIVLGIAMAYGLNVMGDVKTDMTANSSEYNASGDAIDAVAEIPAKLKLIVTVIMAAVIIGILIRYLYVKYS